MAYEGRNTSAAAVFPRSVIPSLFIHALSAGLLTFCQGISPTMTSGSDDVLFNDGLISDALDLIQIHAEGHSTALVSDKWAQAAARVREAVNYTFHKYEAKAWGHDAISPITGEPSDWCKLGVLVLDSLSTLKLTGLDEEFERGRSLAERMLQTESPHGMHSLFETSIRVFGGLLGAHALTGDRVFLDAALRLGDNLVGSFNTQSHLPNNLVDVGTGESQPAWTSLADAGTFFMEFAYLSHISGNQTFVQAANNTQQAIMDSADKAGIHGLLPINIGSAGNSIAFFNRETSLGAGGDSYFEYLLKGWLLTGRTDDRLKDAWKSAMVDMITRMVTRTKSGLTFIADIDSAGQKLLKMQHLTCFVPGMLMLGKATLPQAEVDPRWEPLAHEVAETCYQMYARTPSKLAPEYVTFDIQTNNVEDEMRVGEAPSNMLRPEAAESNYLLWYFTRDPKYRERNLRMFEAFDAHSKAEWGYATVHDVRRNQPFHDNAEESFWMAETLKYLYLSFAPLEKLDLNQYVLNTEAHPLRMWSQ